MICRTGGKVVLADIHTHSVGVASRCALGDDQDLPGFQCSGDGSGGGCRWGSRWRDAGCVQSPGSYQREPAKRPRLDLLPTKVCRLTHVVLVFRVNVTFVTFTSYVLLPLSCTTRCQVCQTYTGLLWRLLVPTRIPVTASFLHRDPLKL